MLCEEKDEMVFVYISRETPNQLFEVNLKWSDQEFQEVEDWMRPIFAHLRNNTNIDEAFDYNNCQGCGYYNFNRDLFNVLRGKVI